MAYKHLNDYPADTESLSLYSIFNAIQDQTEFNPADITRMKCMCYCLDRTARYLSAPEIKKAVNFKLDIYGAGELPASIFPQTIRFHQTSKTLTEHLTIIDLKEKSELIWYEPTHDLSQGRSPSSGGFLYRLNYHPDDLDKLLKRFDDLNPHQ